MLLFIFNGKRLLQGDSTGNASTVPDFTSMF